MAPSLVQSKAGTTTSPTSLTVTLGSPTTAGNCLVVCLGLFGASANPTVTGITLGGSAGNFSSANTAYNNADTNAAIWADPSCAGGQTSVAITCTGSSGSTQICAWVMEFSGVATSSPVDKAPAGANGDSTAWSSGSTGTLGYASEVVIGCGAGTQTPATPGTPWTELAVEAGGSQLFLAAAYQVVSATTALTYNGTTSSSSFWGSCIITLKAAAVTTPSVFQPVREARGRSAVTRGRTASAAGHYTPATPVTPSPFTLPRKPARGQQAAVRGSARNQGGRYTAPPPPVVSPFTLPVRAARGAMAAIRGHARGLMGRYTAPPPVSPFTLPRHPARGAQATRRGTGSAGAATGQGTPVTKRQLLISIATRDGTDDYGHEFVAGMAAYNASGQYVTLTAGDLQFLVAGQYAVGAVAALAPVAGMAVFSGLASASDAEATLALKSEAASGTTDGSCEINAGTIFLGDSGAQVNIGRALGNIPMPNPGTSSDPVLNSLINLMINVGLISP